ncbi:hypothetical protein ETAE_0892 [Edwardsiella piscicida]|uniref:Uncharacterized protein n=1 Tax=Edwardsiella piscicida TaxID=1263550 RepID=A0AAU8PEG6_EDWPI|nr:hypothetical protein ETAE_0892 [Edwardsiella tarda EIB202]
MFLFTCINAFLASLRFKKSLFSWCLNYRHNIKLFSLFFLTAVMKK